MDFECEGGKNDEEEWAQVAARLPLSDGLAMHSQVSDPPYVTIHYNDIYHALQSYFVRKTHDVLCLNKCLFRPLTL